MINLNLLYMKKLFIFIITFLLLLIPGFSNKNQENAGIAYQNLGTYSLPIQNGSIIVTGQVFKYDTFFSNNKTQTGYRYKYDIYVYSRSTLMGLHRNTIIFNSNIYVNGQNVTIIQYPYGMDFLATFQGTNIYVWETNDAYPVFSIDWKRTQIQ
jgi:hypothetical protein